MLGPDGRPMTILMLFPYAPLPPPHDLAGTKRNLPFLLELAKTNQVSVLSFGTERQRQTFVDQYGHLLADVRFVDTRRRRWRNGAERLWLMATFRSPYRQLHRRQMQVAIDQMLSMRAYDVVHCCVPMFGYYRFPKALPVTSDTHEVKFDLLRKTATHERRLLSRTLNYWSAWLGEREEPRLWRRFEALIATTEVDRRRMVAIDSGLSPIVIENGAAKAFFERTDAQLEPHTMVFTGLFTHAPNAQAAEYFLNAIFPLILAQIPDARIYFVGKAPPARLARRASDKVIITGFVEDVRPYLDRAQVFVIPLLSGGGIRGKALEAMAMRKPIVTTTVGVEGIRLAHRRSALFADSPSQFADCVIELFQRPELAAELGTRAFQVACEHYAWVTKGQDLDRSLRHVVAAQSDAKRRSPDTASEAV